MFRKIIDTISGMGGNTLYYPGCMTKFAAPKLFENYQTILKHMEIDFIMIPEFKCCGSPVINAGYEEDFANLVKENSEIFRQYSVKRIICNCPACANMFNEHYQIKAEHITTVIVRNLDRFQKARFNEPVCYHDPCHLARGPLGITQEPRKILGHLGFELVEMDHNSKDTACCGGGGGLHSNYNELAGKVAKMRINECKAGKLITTCPLCYTHLKRNSKGIKVMEFSEVLV